jgi:hypothetical protein
VVKGTLIGAARRFGKSAPPPEVALPLTLEDLIWVIGSFCALNQKPFDPALLINQYAPPYTTESLIVMARALGFRIQGQSCAPDALGTLTLPCIVLVVAPPSGETVAPVCGSASMSASGTPESGPMGEAKTSEGAPLASTPQPVRPAILIQATDGKVTLFEAGTNVPVTHALADFRARATGRVFQLAPADRPLDDPDGALVPAQRFGFRWFVPELLRHKRVWREVLAASLVLQLLALAIPLFTQVIIDRVITHHAQSTLIVIGFGMAMFLVFSTVLSWVRQYLVLHTGNRVDAVLGAAVFEHILKLPLGYFAHRPTGVITTRLQGVETIREFVAGAAVTLILDLPFLVIFVAIMFYYSVVLTLIALTLIGLVAGISFVIAPIFRERLNAQYLLGARNQAFATEYIAGMETVKSLQMEPTVNARYRDYWAQFLRAGFEARQIANTYNVVANGLVARDPGLRGLLRHERHVVYRRHAGGLPDVCRTAVPADAALSRPLAAVPAGPSGGGAFGRRHERARGTLYGGPEPPTITSGRHRAGGRELSLWRGPAVSVRKLQSDHRPGPDRRRDRSLRVRQEHVDEAAPGILSADGRYHPHRWHRHQASCSQRAASGSRGRAAGNDPFYRDALREPLAGPSAGDLR